MGWVEPDMTLLLNNKADYLLLAVFSGEEKAQDCQGDYTNHRNTLWYCLHKSRHKGKTTTKNVGFCTTNVVVVQQKKM